MAATDPQRSVPGQRQSELESALSIGTRESRLARQGCRVHWRRGFIDELHLELPAWSVSDGASSAAGRFTAILPPTRRELLRSLLSPACRFTALLTTLRIIGDTDYGSEKEFRLPPNVAADLLDLPCFARLKTLDFADNGTVVLGADTIAAVVSSVNLRGLWKLTLNTHPLGDEGTRSLANSARLSNLLSLQLYRTGIDNNGARALASSPYLGNLIDLDLRNNRI